MADDKRRLIIEDLSGGRNGYLAPLALAPNECSEAINVDYYRTNFANKRPGATAVSTGATFATEIISWLYRHVPGTSQGAAELWAAGDATPPTFAYMAGGTAFTGVSVTSGPTGNKWEISATSINGKIVLGFSSGVDRLHTGIGAGTSVVRYTGLKASAAPTAADTGAGAYAAILRYYRIRYTVQSGGVTIRRAEASASVAFTPSGGGTAARVTKPAAISEGETHWELEASLDNITFYRIATTVVATTTYDDSAVTTTYNTNPLSASTGIYTLQKSYRFVAADENRVLGFSSFVTTDKQSRIEFSAVIGSLDVGDEERVDTTTNYFLDLDELDSGIPTGLAGPVDGTFFAFKDRQTWQLSPTGQTSQPYMRRAISKNIGAIGFQAIARAEDEQGNPGLYWMSHRGPYRWSKAGGLQYIGLGIEDCVLGPTATINLAATSVVSQVLYYPDRRQVWFWWATGSANDPNIMGIYDVVKGVWSRTQTTDKIGNVRAATMFANTLGVTMSTDLKPYLGQAGSNAQLWKAGTGTDDAGTAFQAYIIPRVLEPGGAGKYGEVGNAVLTAKAGSGVTITASVIGDYGMAGKSSTGTADLTPRGTETRVTVPFYDSALSGDVMAVQYQIGDAAPISNSWTLDRVVIPVTGKGSVTG